MKGEDLTETHTEDSDESKSAEDLADTEAKTYKEEIVTESEDTISEKGDIFKETGETTDVE